MDKVLYVSFFSIGIIIGCEKRDFCFSLSSVFASCIMYHLYHHAICFLVSIFFSKNKQKKFCEEGQNVCITRRYGVILGEFAIVMIGKISNSKILWIPMKFFANLKI